MKSIDKDGPNAETSEPAEAGSGAMRVRVWDPWIRGIHWTLVAGFLVAYLTQGEPLAAHTWAGYAITVALILRILWGFVGPGEARFSRLRVGPGAVFGHLCGLVTGTARRHIGHSPAGAAMTLALLLSLTATVALGLATLAVETGKGPLAPVLATGETDSFEVLNTARATGWEEKAQEASEAYGEGHEASDEGPGAGDAEGLEEAHELAANLSLFLIVVHIVGVFVASLAHRENLIFGMIHGRKRQAVPAGNSD